MNPTRGTVPVSPEVRREALTRRATDLLISDPFGPLMRPVLDELRDEWGIDLRGNPAHQRGMKLLMRAVDRDETPPARAFALLGCAA